MMACMFERVWTHPWERGRERKEMLRRSRLESSMYVDDGHSALAESLLPLK